MKEERKKKQQQAYWKTLQKHGEPNLNIYIGRTQAFFFHRQTHLNTQAPTMNLCPLLSASMCDIKEGDEGEKMNLIVLLQ